MLLLNRNLIKIYRAEFATEAQKEAFYAQHETKKIIQCYVASVGNMVVDYETKSGYFARKVIGKRGDTLHIEYYQNYNLQEMVPFNYITTKRF